LLAHLHKYEKLNIRHNYFSEKQELNIEGKIESSKLELIANKLISELEEVGIYNTEWKDDYEGLLQLFIVYLVFYKLID
jgi:hypothetical protein